MKTTAWDEGATLAPPASHVAPSLRTPIPGFPARRTGPLQVLHSIVAIPLIYLYTIVMATLSLSLSFFDPDGSKQHWCAHVWCRLIVRTVGARVRVYGLENLPPPGTPVVFMANHQSYMDTPAVYGYLPVQFRIIAKESLFKVPFMGWHLRRAGNIPINRTNRREAMRSIRAAAERIRQGTSVVVFPEGTRSRDGVLRDLKAGSFKLAVAAGVPIVPVTIIGTSRVLEKDSLVFSAGPVEMHVGRPIATEGATGERLDALIARVRAAIATPLEPLGLAGDPGRPRSGRGADDDIDETEPRWTGTTERRSWPPRRQGHQDRSKNEETS